MTLEQEQAVAPFDELREMFQQERRLLFEYGRQNVEERRLAEIDKALGLIDQTRTTLEAAQRDLADMKESCAAYKADLSTLKEKRDEALKDRDKWKNICHNRDLSLQGEGNAWVEAMTERDQARKERDELQAKLAQSEAAGAEMRSALERAHEWNQDEDDEYQSRGIYLIITTALSTSCGTAFLAQRARHVKALEFYGNRKNLERQFSPPSSLSTPCKAYEDRGEIAREGLKETCL